MSFKTEGFEVREQVLSFQDLARLGSALKQHPLEPLRGGIRRIEHIVPEVAELAHSPLLTLMARDYLNSNPHLVRAIYFNKTPENNWFVTWHQDRTVAVSERFELEGWNPWSYKAGAWHVQPPFQVLEQMVTIRIHLDPATKANGCLKVAAGSHRLGILPSHKVLEHIALQNIIYCEVSAGGAVVMRPHLFHASDKSSDNTPRRVLHFEYSSFQLPQGIHWAV